MPNVNGARWRASSCPCRAPDPRRPDAIRVVAHEQRTERAERVELVRAALLASGLAGLHLGGVQRRRAGGGRAWPERGAAGAARRAPLHHVRWGCAGAAGCPPAPRRRRARSARAPAARPGSASSRTMSSSADSVPISSGRAPVRKVGVGRVQARPDDAPSPRPRRPTHKMRCGVPPFFSAPGGSPRVPGQSSHASSAALADALLAGQQIGARRAPSRPDQNHSTGRSFDSTSRARRPVGGGAGVGGGVGELRPTASSGRLHDAAIDRCSRTAGGHAHRSGPAIAPGRTRRMSVSPSRGMHEQLACAPPQ